MYRRGYLHDSATVSPRRHGGSEAGGSCAARVRVPGPAQRTWQGRARPDWHQDGSGSSAPPSLSRRSRTVGTGGRLGSSAVGERNVQRPLRGDQRRFDARSPHAGCASREAGGGAASRPRVPSTGALTACFDGGRDRGGARGLCTGMAADGPARRRPVGGRPTTVGPGGGHSLERPSGFGRLKSRTGLGATESRARFVLGRVISALWPHGCRAHFPGPSINASTSAPLVRISYALAYLVGIAAGVISPGCGGARSAAPPDMRRRQSRVEPSRPGSSGPDHFDITTPLKIPARCGDACRGVDGASDWGGIALATVVGLWRLRPTA